MIVVEQAQALVDDEAVLAEVPRVDHNHQRVQETVGAGRVLVIGGQLVAQSGRPLDEPLVELAAHSREVAREEHQPADARYQTVAPVGGPGVLTDE